MVDKPPAIPPSPPFPPPTAPKSTKPQTELPNPFPQFNFATAGISQSEFTKKFWQLFEKSMGDVINNDMRRMKEASDKLKKSMESEEEGND